MKLLLDTHIFLWCLGDDVRLPASIRTEVANRSNDVYLSPVSIWECVIKYALGKLPLPSPAHEFLPDQREQLGIETLIVDEESVVRVAELPSLHRDPFDRLLLGQALQHQLTLVTVDAIVLSYPVPTWDGS